MVAATEHDRLVREDYQRLRALGIRTVREGLRWHLIELQRGIYDFGSVVPFLDEADISGIEIIWDLLHFGWPDHQDPLDAEWPFRFAEFAGAFAQFLILKTRPDVAVWIAPINEISFLAWAGGETGGLNPFATGQGSRLKQQLVKGAVEAVRTIRGKMPRARFLWPEPAIHIVGEAPEAEQYRLAMFEAWDMVAGTQAPELGGRSSYLDVVGVNFYERNQWRHLDRTIFRGEPDYRPFRNILVEIFQRYRKPIVISETGIEGSKRADWFAYITAEVEAAIQLGVTVEGICWYPILNHPGWDDDRHCHNGLWDFPDNEGNREAYLPLSLELIAAQTRRGVICTMNIEASQTIERDLICFSHLRWDGVFQRPQHLMSRFADRQRVFFVEEPIFGAETSHVSTHQGEGSTVIVVTPHLQETSRFNATTVTSTLLGAFFADQKVDEPIVWFYTPMALDWLPRSCRPSLIAYDCMDELTLFRGAPPELAIKEEMLFEVADVVFTGGKAIYESKRNKHSDVHAFPSAVDVKHFAAARAIPDDRADQKTLPKPRIGFAGVIDERMNLELVRELAELRPALQFVFLGPTAKIEPSALPRLPNVHWLGQKKYGELPAYFAGWEIAIMPFALNDSTRYISPTKTPEFLAAGLPVISTRIRDVVDPYGSLGLVKIADTASDFARELDLLLLNGPSVQWETSVKSFLQTISWDATWSEMAKLIRQKLRLKSNKKTTIVSESSVSYV